MVFRIVGMPADSPASIPSDRGTNALGLPRYACSVSGPSGLGFDGDVNIK